jgi:uncharacterized protein YndB with AHSA1/START domain
MSSNPTVRVVRHLPFPAERVFDAWLDPVFASKWLFATPTGQMIRAEADPRVGGRFTFTERRGADDVEHTGEYLEITRPSRLVFTFGVPKYSPDFNRVTVEIAPESAGCKLTLTQEMLPQWASFQHRTQLGWTTLIEGLAANLGDQQAATNREYGDATKPGEVRLLRLLPGPIERVWEYLTDSEKRSTWFTGGSMELRVGGRVEFLFRHSLISPDEQPPEKYQKVHDPGVPMTGLVTRYEPPRLLGLTWEGNTPEEESEVVFELIPQGDAVRLELTHRRLSSDNERADVSSGWHIHTAILYARLAGNTPPPLWAMHDKLEAEYKQRFGVS